MDISIMSAIFSISLETSCSPLQGYLHGGLHSVTSFRRARSLSGLQVASEPALVSSRAIWMYGVRDHMAASRVQLKGAQSHGEINVKYNQYIHLYSLPRSISDGDDKERELKAVEVKPPIPLPSTEQFIGKEMLHRH